MAAGADVVLVSQGLEQVMRPLARHLGVKWVIANRMEFRDGFATGRLLDPVIRPRGIFARLDGRRSRRRARRSLAGSGFGICTARSSAWRSRSAARQAVRAGTANCVL